MATQRPTPQQNRLLGRPSAAVGKGQTAVQAKVSCLAEAVERYSCGFFPDVATRQATLAEMGQEALQPADFLLYSDRQYANREASNREKGLGFNWVPEPFDPAEAIDWTPVWSLSHQRQRWLPSLACYYGYSARLAPAARLFAGSDSNGCAAGNNLSEAILQGLLEAVERDACALWWYNRVQRPALDLASFEDPFFDAMVEHYAGQGRSLELLDLRNDLGIPAIMAVSWRLEDGGRIHFGLGCHLEPRMAASRALSELNQLAVADEVIAQGRPQDRGPMDPLHEMWLAEVTLESQPYLKPLSGPRVTAQEMPDLSSDDITEDVMEVVGRLRDLGHETLVLDHSRPDIDFSTARVVVPGLRHFWERLAPGRLYDVPVSLGWLEKPLREEEMNPIAFFL